jgi:hypothetical protein
MSTLLINAQSKMITKAGVIAFDASVPLFEEVKAKNEAVSCVFKTSSGEIAVLALVKGFRFKVALMEEHFNENYAESDQFKKATFKGKLENFEARKLSETPTEYVLLGKIEFHGKTNDVKTIATVKKVSGEIEILTDFSLLATDFDIKIPNLVKNKLTNKVNLKCQFVFRK